MSYTTNCPLIPGKLYISSTKLLVLRSESLNPSFKGKYLTLNENTPIIFLDFKSKSNYNFYMFYCKNMIIGHLSHVNSKPGMDFSTFKELY